VAEADEWAGLTFGAAMGGLLLHRNSARALGADLSVRVAPRSARGGAAIDAGGLSQ
jgi:hypothetical protein